MQGPGPSRGAGSGSTAGWIYVQNSGALEISSLVHPCPEVAPFPGLAWPFWDPLGISQALRGTCFPQPQGPVPRGRKRWCVASRPHITSPFFDACPSLFCCHRDFDLQGKGFDLIPSKGIHEENEMCLRMHNKAVTQRCRREDLELLRPSRKLLQQFSAKY